MLLRHLHLPSLSTYAGASAIQSSLVRLHLDYKAVPDRARQKVLSPHPTLLTFQTFPTYTCGRREIGNLSSAHITYLQNDGKAEFHEALRGGQTTFHGPGQLTAYLILSLNAHGLSPRSYVRLLESSVIDACHYFGIKGFTTENPGVWTTPDDKIASVGVHLRRSVSSHGIGLNVGVDLKWFDRIVACGLVGKRTTSFEKEGVLGVDIADVADVFAKCVASRLEGISGVEELSNLQITDYNQSSEKKLE